MKQITHPFAYVLCCLLSGAALPPAAAEETPAPTDLMNFAQGVLPVAITSGPSDLRVGMDHAIAAIDGNPGGYVALRKPALDGDVVEITYSLPALTRFDSFSIPNIRETPSPSQTFFGRAEVFGSETAQDGPYLLLASGKLQTHAQKGQITALDLATPQPSVRWIRLRLEGGIDIQRDKTFLEFSELIGTGIQQDAPLWDGFRGVWSGRGVKLELAQNGATVEGCYDDNSELTGTVHGRILRALGISSAGIVSQFILIGQEDGGLRGLRSTNGAPFHPYDGAPSDKPPRCTAPQPPKLSCGAVVHGIGFEFDSAAIRPTSATVIRDLYAGLSQDRAAGIVIVGHSSSEGAADYNRDLSQRRAQSVASALVALGIDPAQISATGRGEDAPIASNSDEAGRSLNRRVEVRCAG